MTPVATPERTCVGCRRRRDQADLLRLVLRQGIVVPAAPGGSGRGAYVCRDARCLAAAEKKRAFARSFRGPATLSPAVREAVTSTTDFRKAVR